MTAAVSPLGFGGAPIGNLYAPVPEADAQSALQEALARGVRYFDTAPFYGHGLSEERIGRALAERLEATISAALWERLRRRGLVDADAVLPRR